VRASILPLAKSKTTFSLFPPSIGPTGIAATGRFGPFLKQSANDRYLRNPSVQKMNHLSPFRVERVELVEFS
jgi:hypothetical protein